MFVSIVPNYPAFSAWNGTAATPVQIAGAMGFGFTFLTTADITADTTFTFQGAPFSDTTPCAPGTFEDILEVKFCSNPSTSTDLEKVVIPKGTPKGSVCCVTLPCVQYAFVQVKAAGGDTAKVTAAVTLAGKKLN